jgi:phage shock protein A
MSILDRLNLLVRSNINDRIGSSRPDSGAGSLQEMEQSLREARGQLSMLRGDERRLMDQLRASRDKLEQWEERALLALRSGSEDLAREALEARGLAAEEATRLRDQLDELRTYMRDISSALEALEIKLRGLQERVQVQQQPYGGATRGEWDWDAEFERRMRERGQRVPQVSSHPSSTELPPLGNAETWRTFERLSDKIAQMEAEVEAARLIGSRGGEGTDPLIDPRRAELESKFKSMERAKREDDDLSELKKKFM